MPDQSLQVIDYKTTNVLDADNSQLVGLAKARGYDQQLAIYCEAIQAIYPERKVSAGVFFTSLCKFCSILSIFILYFIS